MSPFYRTSSPTGAAAQKGRKNGESIVRLSVSASFYKRQKETSPYGHRCEGESEILGYFGHFDELGTVGEIGKAVSMILTIPMNFGLFPSQF